jgi:hypothetical protein
MYMQAPAFGVLPVAAAQVAAFTGATVAGTKPKTVSECGPGS